MTALDKLLAKGRELRARINEDATPAVAHACVTYEIKDKIIERAVKALEAIKSDGWIEGQKQ
jgi:hypothetical protein